MTTWKYFRMNVSVNVLENQVKNSSKFNKGIQVAEDDPALVDAAGKLYMFIKVAKHLYHLGLRDFLRESFRFKLALMQDYFFQVINGISIQFDWVCKEHQPGSGQNPKIFC